MKYEELIRRSYNNKACVDAFRDLAASPGNREFTGRAIETALPVLGVVLSMHFRRLKPGCEEYDEIISSVPARLFLHIIKDRFYQEYYEEPASQFSYLFTYFYYEILNVLKKCKRLASLHHDVPCTSFLAFNFEAASTSTECRVHVSELPRHIKDTVIKRIRFCGDERDLCVFLVESLVDGKGIPAVILRQRWGVRDPEFFSSYIRVLIRSVLLEMKPDIDRIPSVEDADQEGATIRSMYDTFTAGLHAGREAEFWFGCDNAWGGSDART